MAVLEVLSVPHPILRKKALPVEVVDDGVRKLLNDMLETMYAEEGCGLAAPQVGVSQRIIVVDISYRFPDVPLMKMVNPQILWSSHEKQTFDEGCLSVPGMYGPVTRPEKVKISYLDENGVAQELEAADFLATAIQHEIDHLNGKVFTDYFSPLKREMLKRKAKRANKSKDI
jgi:peptide deformylase